MSSYEDLSESSKANLCVVKVTSSGIISQQIRDENMFVCVLEYARHSTLKRRNLRARRDVPTLNLVRLKKKFVFFVKIMT